jgi:hypothetical protein
MVMNAIAASGLTEGPRSFMDRWSRGTYAVDPEFERRIMGNAEVLFAIDLMTFASYVPNVEAIRCSRVSLALLAGEESPAELPEISGPSRWLAKHLGVELRRVPGAHSAYFDRPGEFVEALRPILEEV